MSDQAFNILINGHSGTAAEAGKDGIEAALAASGLPVASFDYAEPAQVTERLSELVRSDRPLLVGGGDGTISMAGVQCLEAGKPFGVLPYGTMNLLARDLNVPVGVEEAFRAYRRTKEVSIDVGMANGQPFFCVASLGVMPEAAKVREETRGYPEIVSLPKMGLFVYHELDESNHRALSLLIDGRRRKMQVCSMVVSNNIYTVTQPDDSHRFRRASLQGGQFGVYVARPRGFWGKMALLVRLRLGGWKADPSVREYSGRQVIAHLRGSEGTALVSLDGEPREMQSPLNFEMKPKALKLIVPANGPA